VLFDALKMQFIQEIKVIAVAVPALPVRPPMLPVTLASIAVAKMQSLNRYSPAPQWPALNSPVLEYVAIVLNVHFSAMRFLVVPKLKASYVPSM
jgi:hypothetical protein